MKQVKQKKRCSNKSNPCQLKMFKRENVNKTIFYWNTKFARHKYLKK